MLNLAEPADLELAQIHGKANRVLKIASVYTTTVISKCICCNLPVDGEKFKFFGSANELTELGVSIPLYFYFVIVLSCILLAAFFIANLPYFFNHHDSNNFLELFKGNNYKKSYIFDVYSYILNLSSIKQSKTINNVEPLCHMLVCALLMCCYPLIVKYFNKKILEITDQVLSPKSYSLFIEGLPRKYTIKELKEHIQIYYDIDCEVANITRCFDIKEFHDSVKTLRNWQFKLKFYQEYYNKTGKKPFKSFFCWKFELDDEEKCNNNIIKYQRLKRYYQYKKKLSPYAIITITTQNDAKNLEKIWKNHQYFQGFCICCKDDSIYKFKNNFIYASYAPECTEIKWKNLSTGKLNKLLRRTLMISFYCALLTFVFILLLFIQTMLLTFKDAINKAENFITVYQLIHIIISLIIIMINKILPLLSRIFSKFERHITWKSQNLSIFYKLLVLMYLMNVFIPWMSLIIMEDSYYDKYGATDSLFWIMISNCYITPLIDLINIKNLLKKRKRNKLLKDAKSTILQISQQEANKIFEGTEIDFPARFANVAKICFLSFAFSTILHWSLLMGAIGLALDGLVFKYLLLNVYARPRKYNSDVVIGAIKSMPLIILSYCIGIILTYLLWTDTFMYCLMIFFGSMCLFYVIFMYFGCCSSLFNKASEQEVLINDANDYFINLSKFQSDYERENPATSKKGWERWLKFMNNEDKEEYMNQ